MRKSMSKKLRFEIFARDNFSCQYCGKKAPEVLLEVDHINPVNKGGNNDKINLITSCFECNRGKGKKTIPERAELEKQHKELKELNEKRIQLKAMVEWKKNLANLDNEKIDVVQDIFKKNYPTNKFSDIGRKRMLKLLKKTDFDIVLSEAERCSKWDKDEWWDKIEKGCFFKQQERKFPYKIFTNKVLTFLKFSLNYNMNNIQFGIMRNRLDDIFKTLSSDESEQIFHELTKSINIYIFYEQLKEIEISYFSDEGE